MPIECETEDGEWIKCPLFFGDADLQVWITAIEIFFHQFQIPTEQHVNLASHHILGVAGLWVSRHEDNIACWSWSQLLEALRDDFDSTTTVEEATDSLVADNGEKALCSVDFDLGSTPIGASISELELSVEVRTTSNLIQAKGTTVHNSESFTLAEFPTGQEKQGCSWLCVEDVAPTRNATDQKSIASDGKWNYPSCVGVFISSGVTLWQIAWCAFTVILRCQSGPKAFSVYISFGSFHCILKMRSSHLYLELSILCDWVKKLFTRVHSCQCPISVFERAPLYPQLVGNQYLLNMSILWGFMDTRVRLELRTTPLGCVVAAYNWNLECSLMALILSQNCEQRLVLVETASVYNNPPPLSWALGYSLSVRFPRCTKLILSLGRIFRPRHYVSGHSVTAQVTSLIMRYLVWVLNSQFQSILRQHDFIVPHTLSNNVYPVSGVLAKVTNNGNKGRGIEITLYIQENLIGYLDMHPEFISSPLNFFWTKKIIEKGNYEDVDICFDPGTFNTIVFHVNETFHCRHQAYDFFGHKWRQFKLNGLMVRVTVVWVTMIMDQLLNGFSRVVSMTQDTVVYPMGHLVLSSHHAFNSLACPFTPGSTPHRGRMAEFFILCFDPGILYTLHTRDISAKHLLWSWSHVYICLYLCEKVMHTRILTYLMHAQGELVWYPVVRHHQGGRLCISMMSVLYWLTLKNAAPKVWEGSHNGTSHQFLYALTDIFEFDPEILLSSYPIMQLSMGRLLLLHHPLLVTTWILGIFCWLIAWSTKGKFQGAKRKAVELCACEHAPEFHIQGFIVKFVNAATTAEKCAIVLKALKGSTLYPFLKQLSAGFSSWSWQQLLSNAVSRSSFGRARVCHLSVCQSIAIFTLLCQSGSLIFHTTIEINSQCDLQSAVDITEESISFALSTCLVIHKSTLMICKYLHPVSTSYHLQTHLFALLNSRIMVISQMTGTELLNSIRNANEQQSCVGYVNSTTIIWLTFSS